MWRERLDAFGVDYIEGGWPGSNPKDVAFFEEAAKRTWKHARIAAFGMTRRGKHEGRGRLPKVKMLLDAKTPVVTIVGKTWPLHVTEVFNVLAGRKPRDDRRHRAASEDARTRGDLRCRAFFRQFPRRSGIFPHHDQGGARRRGRSGRPVRYQWRLVAGLCVSEVTARAVAHLGALGGNSHATTTAGVGVANALAAVRAGAVQVQGTINGYGERVGNCNLTTVIPTLQLKLDITVVPDLSQLHDVSAFVDELANVPHDIRAPYVGSAAFTHKGGLHVHAVQKLARTYEHISTLTWWVIVRPSWFPIFPDRPTY